MAERKDYNVSIPPSSSQGKKNTLSPRLSAARRSPISTPAPHSLLSPQLNSAAVTDQHRVPPVADTVEFRSPAPAPHAPSSPLNSSQTHPQTPVADSQLCILGSCVQGLSCFLGRFVICGASYDVLKCSSDSVIYSL